MNRNSGKIQSAGSSLDVNLVLRFRIPLLIIFLTMTAFFCLQLKGLKMEPETLESMYPAGHAFLPQLQAIKKMAPPPRMLIGLLEVKRGDIYNPATIRKIGRITKNLTSIEGILPAGITSLTQGIDHYNNTADGLSIEPILGRKWPETQKELASLKRKIAINPKGLGRYVAYDGTAAMITAPIVNIEEIAKASYKKLSDIEKAEVTLEQFQNKSKASFQKKLIKGTNKIKLQENDENHTLFFMGPQLIEAHMTAMGFRHIPMAGAAMLVIIIFLLAAYFKTLAGILLPLLAMIISMLWGMGAYAAWGFDFNPMALTFPVILGVFSLSVSVSAMKQFYARYSVTGDKGLAIRAGFGGLPVILSIITIGLTTLALYASPVPLFKNLAWLGLFWLMGTIIAVMFVTPLLLSLFSVPNQGVKNNSHEATSSLAAGWRGPTTKKNQWFVLFLLMALLIIGSFAGYRLKIGDNLPGTSYIRPGHPRNQCFDLLSKKFMGPYQLLVYVKAKEKGGLLKAEALNAIGDFSRYLTDQGGARDSIAFDMMIEMSRYMLTDGNPKWQIIPASKNKIEGLAGLVMEQGGVEEFIDKTFSEATLSPFFPEKTKSRIDEYAAMMQAYIECHPSETIEFRLGGGLLGMAKTINDGTQKAYTIILPTAFSLVFGLSVLVFGSLFLGFVVTLPIAAAQAGIWIIMMATGIKVSLPVALASAPAIGFGALFGFHLIPSLRKAANIPVGRRADRQNHLYEMSGIALFLGLLIFAAMLPWFFIGLKFQSDIALAVGITILFETGLSLLFIPVILDRLNPRLTINDTE